MIDTRTWTMGHYPMPAAKPLTDADLVAQARLFNHHGLADRLQGLIVEQGQEAIDDANAGEHAAYTHGRYAQMLAACVCNVGAQECPIHPGNVKSQDAKVAFRLAWDEAVRAAKEDS